MKGVWSALPLRVKTTLGEPGAVTETLSPSTLYWPRTSDIARVVM